MTRTSKRARRFEHPNFQIVLAAGTIGCAGGSVIPWALDGNPNLLTGIWYGLVSAWTWLILSGLLRRRATPGHIIACALVAPILISILSFCYYSHLILAKAWYVQ